MLGTQGLRAYCAKYGCTLDPQLAALCGNHSAKPWSKFVTADNQHLVSPEALDLLDKLLRWGCWAVLGVAVQYWLSTASAPRQSMNHTACHHQPATQSCQTSLNLKPSAPWSCRYDQQERVNPEEAMQHPYFAEVHAQELRS